MVLLYCVELNIRSPLYYQALIRLLHCWNLALLKIELSKAKLFERNWKHYYKL